MPTELEELVGFIAHGNPQIRLVALENLVPYSTSQPSIFKSDDLLPVKHLTMLVEDHPKLAEHALSILVNLSADRDVLKRLATDEEFLGVLYARLIRPSEPNANLLSMLLANLAKWDGLKNIIDREQTAPEALGSDRLVINQLVDLFVKGVDGRYNKLADYDYLAYLFADLAKHAEVRQYFARRQSYDNAIPLTKVEVFTEHASDIRRRGVASSIKNVAFDTSLHEAMLSEDEINILPYILLPITGNEVYAEEESSSMLPDLQLLPPEKRRDADPSIIQTHVETLTLLTSTRHGRDVLRQINVYPIIREVHLHVEDEGVREACERLVQVLKRDEADEPAENTGQLEDEDDLVVEV